MRTYKKERKVNELSSQRAALLLQIFRTKSWGEMTEFGNSEYDDFCEMLTYLNAAQQDLIIHLTKDFLKVGINEYLRFFLISFDSFLQSTIIQNKKRIFIIPLLRPKDFGKSKSSVALYYQIKTQMYNFQNKYPNYTIICSDDLNSLCNLDFMDSDVVCPIDDFIGTGETAIDAINFLFGSGISRQNIAVIALVGQEAGINNIENAGNQVFVAELRKRGISDIQNDNDIEGKKNIMGDIEDLMKVKSSFRMGYGQSEALVKMINTPNNTFPIFWYAKSKTLPVVPFPRG